jgi:hypothetical protein
MPSVQGRGERKVMPFVLIGLVALAALMAASSSKAAPQGGPVPPPPGPPLPGGSAGPQRPYWSAQGVLDGVSGRLVVPGLDAETVKVLDQALAQRDVAQLHALANALSLSGEDLGAIFVDRLSQSTDVNVPVTVGLYQYLPWKV